MVRANASNRFPPPASQLVPANFLWNAAGQYYHHRYGSNVDFIPAEGLPSRWTQTGTRRIDCVTFLAGTVCLAWRMAGKPLSGFDYAASVVADAGQPWSMPTAYIRAGVADLVPDHVTQAGPRPGEVWIVQGWRELPNPARGVRGSGHAWMSFGTVPRTPWSHMALEASSKEGGTTGTIGPWQRRRDRYRAGIVAAKLRVAW